LQVFGYNEDFIDEDIRNEMYQVNCNSAITLASAFPNSHFVFFSSCAVLGTIGTKGLETYAETKRLAEEKLSEICTKLTIVRPTVIDTKFPERAKIPPYSTKGYLSPQDVVKYIIKNLNKTLVLPGWQAHMLHWFNKINPTITQFFLNSSSGQTKHKNLQLPPGNERLH
jgi:short-subunit dehydrogenase